MKNDFPASFVCNSLLMGADFYRPDLDISDIPTKMTTQIDNNGIYSNGLTPNVSDAQNSMQQQSNQFYFDTGHDNSSYYPNGITNTVTSSTDPSNGDDRYNIQNDSVSFLL